MCNKQLVNINLIYYHRNFFQLKLLQQRNTKIWEKKKKENSPPVLLWAHQKSLFVSRPKCNEGRISSHQFKILREWIFMTVFCLSFCCLSSMQRNLRTITSKKLFSNFDKRPDVLTMNSIQFFCKSGRWNDSIIHQWIPLG